LYALKCWKPHSQYTCTFPIQFYNLPFYKSSFSYMWTACYLSMQMQWPIHSICKKNIKINKRLNNLWLFSLQYNSIGSIMVSVFVSSAIDSVFELRSVQTKSYKTGICCFSAMQAALRSWLGIRSGATCPHSTQRVGL
jgi:uncharacterized membrane protein